MLIRDARPGELAQVGEIRVTAYRAGGHLSAGSRYEPRLRELGADGAADVLVAVTDQASVVGTVTLQVWPATGEFVRAAGEAEIRALAVAPEAQGAGIGVALLLAIIERARERSVRHLLLQTQPDMVAAQRMYVRAGFDRLPDRDREQYELLAYGLWLPHPVPES